MRHRAIITRLALALPLLLSAFPAQAQEASEQEKAVLTGIAQCLVAGLPQDWRQAEMNVILPAPGAVGGEVNYRMSRSLSGDLEPFQPCDARKPAQALVEMRKLQPPEVASWNAARLVIHRDGKFDLKYDYPKPN
jgi:hypothetical protein